MSIFPEILHIDDVLPHIQGNAAIILIEKEDYDVLDYVYVTPDTFNNAWARECRGLKFDKQGNLIARPFHKFFNLDEREETNFTNLDWNADWILMEKLDGSMIHPVLIDGQLRLMTRKGESDVAKLCMQECDPSGPDAALTSTHEYMMDKMKAGWTPIYEYTSPNNRIVVDYRKPALNLLMFRNNLTGEYRGIGHQVDYMMNMIDEKDEKEHSDPYSLIDKTRNMRGQEGFVLRWPDGSMVKIKADEYVSLHRSMDAMTHEKRIIEVILNNSLDDLLPLLDDDRRNVVEEYSRCLMYSIRYLVISIAHDIEIRKHHSQKKFAEYVLAYVDKRFQPCFFKARSQEASDYLQIQEIVVEYLKAKLTSQTKIDSYRTFIGVDFYEMRDRKRT